MTLNFGFSHSYAAANGIDLPTELRVGDQRVDLIARLDTGGAHSIFERSRDRMLYLSAYES
jgi:hypothetical protein